VLGFKAKATHTKTYDDEKRIIGFDLDRAYAILEMFNANFNTVFGSFTNKTVLGNFFKFV
jgi:hypothetical protein